MLKKLSIILCIILSLSLIFEPLCFAQGLNELNIAGYLGQLHSRVTTDKFRPLHLRYISYGAQDNTFRLFIDKGDLKNPGIRELEDTSKELLKYFFIGISLPNDGFWVNLRPDAEDNIIDDYLAQTDMGKIMLEADLQLKKDTALATSPETPEGREYWHKLYQKAGELFGSDNITIPTLTRPWIVPDEIIVREATASAYIYKATLKVCLEQDYLKNDTVYNFKDERLKQLNEYSSQLIRELIIPKLSKEINTSKKYASLRQVYYSLILSQWFKARFYGKGGTYSRIINSKDLTNLISKDYWSKTTYFRAYQKSFKDGEYNLKEPIYTPYGQTIRSYFSGGMILSSSDLDLALRSPTAKAGNVMIQPAAHDFDASSSPILAEMVIQANNPGEIVIQNEGNFAVSYPSDTESVILPTQKEMQEALAQKTRVETNGVGVEILSGSLPIREKSYIVKLKDAVLNFLKGAPQKEPVEEEQLIEEAIQASGLKPDLADSYARFIAEQGAYLRVASQEKTVRWDYLKGPDKCDIRKALNLLSELKFLGHGTIGFQNTEDNHDRKISAGDTDYIGAVRLLNIILSGEIRDSSVSEFVAERQDYFKLNPNYYGPFFVILKPGIKESDLGKTGNMWNDRFRQIESKFHYAYLLPRTVDKEFFTKAIERAVKEGIISKDKGRETISKLKTVAEFLEEKGGGHLGPANLNPAVTSLIPKRVSSPLIAPKLDAKGGIDFRTLPIVTQALSNLRLNASRISLGRLESINLDQELKDIQKMIGVGITPSAERIKEYVQLSCLKGNPDIKKVVSCIANILRLEEERCCSSDVMLKDMLIVLESTSSPEELKAIFIKQPN